MANWVLYVKDCSASVNSCTYIPKILFMKEFRSEICVITSQKQNHIPNYTTEFKILNYPYFHHYIINS